MTNFCQPYRADGWNQAVGSQHDGLSATMSRLLMPSRPAVHSKTQGTKSVHMQHHES